MNDSSYPELTPTPKAPDPALLAEEEALWKALVDDFDEDERHNAYMGFLIKNNLLVQGSRRFGEFAQDKENRSVEQRRIANLKQQQIAKILFFVPETNVGGTRPQASKVEMSAVLAGVILGLFGLGYALFGARGQIIMRVFAGLLSVIVFGGGGYYLYAKVKEGTERLNREP